MLETATAELTSEPAIARRQDRVLLDIAIGSKAEAAFVNAVIAAAKTVIATVPSGDHANARSSLDLDSTGRRRADGDQRTRIGCSSICSPTIRRRAASNDESVVLFSAPGEGREAIEIARRLLQEAAARRAVRSDGRAAARAADLSRACSNTRSIAPAFRRGSIAAPGGPIRPAARCSRCWRARTKSCRRADSPNTCRSARCR